MAHTDSRTVRQILAAHGVDTDQPRYDELLDDVHIVAAHSLVERKVAPAVDVSTDLALTEAYIAAAYAVDATGGGDGTAAISSIQQGSRQISFETEDLQGLAKTLWKKALREDPSGRLVRADNPTASLSVPDIRGSEY